MTKDEALKLALDALDLLAKYENPSTKIQVRKPRDGGPIVTMYPHKVATDAAALLRERLAQPEQEPVVWMYQDKTSHAVKFQRHMSNFVDHSKTSEIPLYSEPLANHELQCVCGAVWCGDEMVHLPNKIPPQPEPVIDKSAAIRIATSLGWEPKRAWVGLTEDEINEVLGGDIRDEPSGELEFVRAIEAKLKEKNT